MISFDLPMELENQQTLLQMVAEQSMRPYSRELDENEHQRPVAFVEMMWPMVQQQMKGYLKGEARKAEANGHNGHNGTNGSNGHHKNGNGSSKKQRTEFLSMIMMVEMLSWGDAAQYLGMPHPMLGGSAVQSVGTLEQKQKFLGKFTNGQPKWGAMAITEPNAGSDNSSMRTTAYLDEATNEWVINGEKVFITNGALSLAESDGFCVVWATVDPEAGRAGIKSFVVEGNNPGVTVAKQEHKLGIRASDTVSLHFDNARIPYENLLGSAEVKKKKSNAGFKGAMKTFDASRPAVAASAMGIARAALEFTKETLAKEGIVVDYTKPKNEMCSIERDLVEMEGLYKSGWLLTLRAASQIDNGESNRLEASMSKLRAGEVVTRITQMAVELLGPIGYTRDTLVEKWMRDAKINDIYEGTRQINQLIVARSILGYSRRELS